MPFIVRALPERHCVGIVESGSAALDRIDRGDVPGCARSVLRNRITVIVGDKEIAAGVDAKRVRSGQLRRRTLDILNRLRVTVGAGGEDGYASENVPRVRGLIRNVYVCIGVDVQ